MWFNLCPVVYGCRRSPSSGDLCAWGTAGGLAADHRSVWEAVASLQTFLPSAGGAAHSVQHSPHLRSGLMNLDSKELLEHRNGHADRETCTKISYHMYKCDLILLLIMITIIALFNP